MKTCTKCKIEKPYEDFRKSARYKDGHYSRCKACVNEYERSIYDQEHKLELRRRYRENNRQRIREQDSERYKSDPEKYRAKARINQKKYFQSEKGREKYRLESLKLRKKYPEKVRARSLLSNAICDGRIKRPETCSLCRQSGINIEAHHPDYSKPYDVIWVCRSCHFLVHGRIKHHADRLSEKTGKPDAIVKTHEETVRGTSEE